MQPYKRTKRSFSLAGLLVRGVLIVGAIALLFFILRSFIGQSRLAPLDPAAVREGLQSKATLIAKIEELQNAIDAGAVLVAQADALKKENQTLKTQLGRSVGVPGILARVVASPERSFYDTLVIDAGSEEGVIEGSIVYAFDSVALGTVASVDMHRSVVELFSAPDRQTAGTAEGSETTITLIGRGGGEYEVRMPRDIHFTVGELVSLQTVQTAVIAKIEKIITDPRDPFQRLLAKAPVNLNTLKFVIVR